MTLAERAPNLMQRLSRLPTPPHVALLHRRKPKLFTLSHATPPLESRLISDGVASTHGDHRVYQTWPSRFPEEPPIILWCPNVDDKSCNRVRLSSLRALHIRTRQTA